MDPGDTERLIVHQDGSPPAAAWRQQQQPQRRRHLRRPKADQNEGSLDDDHDSSGGGHDAATWNHSMTFDGRVFLSRLVGPAGKKSDYVLVLALIFGLFLCAVALFFAYFHQQLFHYHVTGLYARLGHADAQHLMGDKLLHGKGVDKDEEEAMTWFGRAAAQGHPHSAYNLAIGHLRGMKTGLEPGQAHQLIQHAADNGVILAKDVLLHVCQQGGCD